MSLMPIMPGVSSAPLYIHEEECGGQVNGQAAPGQTQRVLSQDWGDEAPYKLPWHRQVYLNREMNEVASINKFQTSNTTGTDKANKSSTMYKADNLLPKISTMDIGPSSLSSWPTMWEGRFILSTFGRSRAGSTLPAYWCPYSQLSQSLTGDHWPTMYTSNVNEDQTLREPCESNN